MKLAIRILRVLVATLFLYAGVVKLGASERFTITVAQIALLPPAWVAPLAMVLPWAEMLTGVLMLIPRTARLGALAAAGLLAVFLTALTWAWTQGLAVDCGCFGEDATGNVRDQIPVALARDILLLPLTLLLAARRSY
ncbi:MAG: MauE/DoxX family redox-associated membrane protein [Chthoniobacterales bacterium]